MRGGGLGGLSRRRTGHFARTDQGLVVPSGILTAPGPMTVSVCW